MNKSLFKAWLDHPVTVLLKYQIEDDLVECSSRLLNVTNVKGENDKLLLIGELIGAIKAIKDIIAIDKESLRHTAEEYVYQNPGSKETYKEFIKHE